MKSKQFFLKNLKYEKSKLNEQSVIFFDKSPNIRESFPTTILIGPNGSGKSLLLSAIVEIFREIAQEIKTSQFKSFSIVYVINGTTIEITKMRNNITYIKNENEKLNDITLYLPQSILASSLMVNDKFTYIDNESLPSTRYKYLGIRNSANSAGTKTFLKKTIDNIISYIQYPTLERNVDIYAIFEFLKFEPNLKLEFKLKKIDAFFSNKKISIDILDRHFLEWHVRRKTEPYSAKVYQELKDNNEIDNILSLINKISKLKDSTNTLVFSLNLNSIEDNKLVEVYADLKKMMSLDLLMSPNIIINKKYDLAEISSGEYNFIFSMINLANNIRENSLVVIDEPEISFHPNWQIDYLDYLKKIFQKFTSCHFIIATHSHFIISNLVPNASSIISMQTSEKEFCKNITRSTYGWSAEDILYNIFHVSTSRNREVYYAFQIIVKELSSPSLNNKNLKIHLNKLSLLKNSLKDNDPLKQATITLLNKYMKKD